MCSVRACVVDVMTKATHSAIVQHAHTKSRCVAYGEGWLLLPVFLLQRPTSFLPQSRSSQICQCYVAITGYKTTFLRFSNCAGRTLDLDMMSCTLYKSVQESTWEKLVEAIDVVAEARKKFAGIIISL